MNNKILTQAKNILSNRRIQAERFSNERKQEYLKDSEFKNIYNCYVDSMILNAKTGKNITDVEKNKKLIEDWLIKNNKPSFTPNYSCPTCQDNGYINGEMCKCLKREITKILTKESGFGELERFSSSDFSKFEKPEEMKKLYSLMEEWCNQSSHKKTLIFLSGNTGVGKTHLTKCMANALIENGHLVNLTTAFNMNQELSKTFSSFDATLFDQTLQKYLDCEYLFIDDLGTEIITKLSIKTLYLVLNERKTRGLSTIITSNLTLKDIRDQYDERIASRIVDTQTSICIRLDGRDLRLKK